MQEIGCPRGGQAARPFEPHEVQAGQYGCGEAILLGVPQKD
jgi:hypothetical protein